MSKIFVSFAIEDKTLRDLFVGQERNTDNDINFTDFSVKKPWDSQWKTNCRARIKGCAGVVGIITKNTPAADGALWELKCAYDEGVPVLLIHGYPVGNSNRFTVSKPKEIDGKMIYNWTHLNVLNFLNKVSG